MQTKAIIRAYHHCKQQEENKDPHEIIILNLMLENQREDQNKTYSFFAGAKKCFDKLWL